MDQVSIATTFFRDFKMMTKFQADQSPGIPKSRIVLHRIVVCLSLQKVLTANNYDYNRLKPVYLFYIIFYLSFYKLRKLTEI